MIIDLEALPSPDLSPNACRYRHWAHGAKARTTWRELVYYRAVAVRNIYPFDKPYHKARLTWTFIYRIKRNRDADNLIASVKAGQDALVKAGIIEADDSEHLILMPPIILVDKGRPSTTIITVEEVRGC